MPKPLTKDDLLVAAHGISGAVKRIGQATNMSAAITDPSIKAVVQRARTKLVESQYDVLMSAIDNRNREVNRLRTGGLANANHPPIEGEFHKISGEFYKQLSEIQEEEIRSLNAVIIELDNRENRWNRALSQFKEEPMTMLVPDHRTQEEDSETGK